MSSKHDKTGGTRVDPVDGGATAAERLRQAIEAASRIGASKAELEHAAMQLVGELKAENAPPEQMLLQIKNILADAGLRPSYATSGDGGGLPGGDAEIYRDLIEFSIRYYYETRGANEP